MTDFIERGWFCDLKPVYDALKGVFEDGDKHSFVFHSHLPSKRKNLFRTDHQFVPLQRPNLFIKFIDF